MKIKIIGTTGEGKTAIANLIFDLLESHGFTVGMENESEVGDYTPQLRAMKRKETTFTIETVQAGNFSFTAIGTNPNITVT